jgi:hypothetical protein
MSKYEMSAGGRGLPGFELAEGAAALGRFMATGFGSRGGPNKPSNKLKRCPGAYHAAGLATRDYFMATALRSRGGPNKPSNKLRTRPGAYHLFN